MQERAAGSYTVSVQYKKITLRGTCVTPGVTASLGCL